MNRTKKVLICLLSVCLLSLGLLPARVHADVLIEPDDSFWKAHQNDCEYLYRTYTVNGADGYAIVWESPVSTRQKEVLANGESVWSNWHYTDEKGEIWCAVMTGEMTGQGYEKVEGWIRTSDCLVNPDYISFREAHEQEFTEYDPAYDRALEGLETVVLWSYPCSGIVKADSMDAEGLRNRQFDTCWRDSRGRMWAFVGYCYGVRNTWICLDDPANPNLEADTGADKDVIPQDAVIYPAADPLPEVKSGVTGLTIAAVLGVVAVTGLLLWVFFGRKKRK
ncbi:MAG: hypothetical protein NC123_11185 [Butyrivibrio sp.]|nr:hypothetical protein [Acetatifactor muris]MCM1560087.1 hypothetical protein [Butyrivibrio sp.]